MSEKRIILAGRRFLCLLLVSLVLAACGGGGSSRPVPPDPPPTGQPPPPPPPPPPVVETPNPAFSKHLQWTGADLAHTAGWSGAGVRIGVIDSGVNRNHPALRGRVMSHLVYVNPVDNDWDVDDVIGHGTAVAQIMAGTAFGQWPGGIAPGAEILSARIISDNPPEDDGSGAGNEVNGALGLAPIHQDLSQRGMRIMNNSWGGLYWNNPNATNAIAAEYRDFVHNRDGLVVFAAGNSGFANPSDTAALPSQSGPGGSLPATDLERGWLAVVALDGDDRNQLADYSNACGVAMHYCLAAPGTAVFTGTDDPAHAPTYWENRGTSFAAPIVSGAAALVWEAFPYFDNDLVRQTLLGTALDLGDPGVDPVFGYGAVDIARAVRGPAQLDWGDFEIRFDEMSSYWGNNLSGAGALVKDGSGTLVLEGEAGNLGGVFVNGGAVQALRTIHADAVVGGQGTLVLGDGVQGGDVLGVLDNAGRVEVLAYATEEVSTTRIGGDYFHRNGATLALQLGQRFAVDGAAWIEGGGFHLLGLKPGYTVGAREQVLAAQMGVNGQFDTLSWADSLFLDGTLGYDTHEVWLDITRLDVAATAMGFAGITPMALSGAMRVEQAFAALDAGVVQGQPVDTAFVEASGQFQHLRDPVLALAALDSLSGQAHARGFTLAFENIDIGRRAVAAHLGAADPAQGGAWTRMLGRDNTGTTPGGGWTQQGWLIGQDRPVGRQAMLGFAFGQTQAEEAASGGARERSRARQTQAHLYLGRVTSSGHLAAQFGFGHSQRRTRRHPFQGDFRQGVHSDVGGRYGSLAVEAAGRLSQGSVRWTPYLGVALDWLEHEGFEEWGGAGFGLRANAARMQRTQSIAGVRAEGTWSRLHLNGHVEWQQVIAANGFAVPASFVGINSWSPLPQAAAARSGGVFGVGIGAHVWPKARLNASVDQRFGPRGSERLLWLEVVRGF